MKNRVISKIILVFLVLSLLVVAVPSAFAKHFDDVTSGMNQEMLDAVNYVSDNNIMDGTATNTFSPYQTITRGMFVTILYRLSGDSGNYNGSAYFTDVSSTAYYNKAVGWAYRNNITDGITDTEFGPNKVLITQQVITFLYRYAGYKGLSQTTKTFVGGSANEVISDATDYSQVSGYAITPMTWASNYGIIVRSSMNNTLRPKIEVPRVSCALYIHRFVLNVQGVDMTKDAFSFINNENSFVVNNHQRFLISYQDRRRLENVMWNSGISRDTYLPDGEFGGYCFGMSIATVLDIQGKIDFNGNLCNNVKNMHGIPKPSEVGNHPELNYSGALKLCKDQLGLITISEVESKIAMYQHSWEVTTISGNLHGTSPGNIYELSNRLHDVVYSLQRGGVGVLSFGFKGDDGNNYYHTVVAYGKPVVTNDGYRINIDDSWRVGIPRYLFINTAESGLWSGVVANTYSDSNKLRLILCKFGKDLSDYSLIDIDGYDNSTTSSRSVQNQKTVIQVIADEDFSIINERGEELVFSEGMITGTMKCYGFDFFPGGLESFCGFVFAVDSAEKFECVQSGEGAITKFSVVQNNQYVSADVTKGQAAHTVVLCEDAGTE